jgi:hypothetical protein
MTCLRTHSRAGLVHYEDEMVRDDTSDRVVTIHPGTIYLWPVFLTAVVVGVIAFVGAAKTASWVPPPSPTEEGQTGGQQPTTTPPTQFNYGSPLYRAGGSGFSQLIQPDRSSPKECAPPADVFPSADGVTPNPQKPAEKPGDPVYRLSLLPVVCALAIPWVYRVARGTGRAAVFSIGTGSVVISAGRRVTVERLTVSEKWRPLARVVGFGGRFVTVVATSPGIRVTVTGHVTPSGYQRLIRAAAVEEGGGS